MPKSKPFNLRLSPAFLADQPVEAQPAEGETPAEVPQEQASEPAPEATSEVPAPEAEAPPAEEVAA